MLLNGLVLEIEMPCTSYLYLNNVKHLSVMLKLGQYVRHMALKVIFPAHKKVKSQALADSNIVGPFF